tara:strand:- start:207 stop:584 length:378 start_codon:yes stop_codon:yes gene_type:complete
MSYQNDVEIFMKIGSQPVQKELSMDSDEAKLYMKLISEEYNETLDAFKKSDLVELADGLADMVWVIMGMCNSCGIQFDNVWKEVRASNMSKFVDGKAIKNEYGKIMKPKTYFKPNIKNALGLEKT